MDIDNKPINIQMQDPQIPVQSPTKLYQLLLVLLSLLTPSVCQFNDPTKVHIESRKYSAISGKEQFIKVSPTRMTYQVPYTRAFAVKPDIGLSVYNLQFDYNPEFSINVVQENSNTVQFQFYLVGRPSQSNIFNELFVMYIASDYEQLGIYMPGPKNTTVRLGVPPSENQPGGLELQKYEDFTFNFKNIGTQPIFPSSANLTNIRVSVYLTGITAFFESDKNGYSRNYAYFSLEVTGQTSRFYTIRVTKRSTSGDILIKVIEFTVVYFDILKMEAEYQINSSSIVSANFGGTFFASSYSAPLDPLKQDSRFENSLQYFFGISAIECSSGQTINLLAVQRFNYNNNGKLQNLVLTFQTEGNTYINRGIFNYIQYKPRSCNDSTSCGIPCNQLSVPRYLISAIGNLCAPCFYFCQACNNSFNCTACPVTRRLSNGGICVCNSNSFFDRYGVKECQACFDAKYCKTCEREEVCLSCYEDKFTFNNQLRICECKAGTYDSVGVTNETNLVSRIDTICLPCPPNCIYCRTATSCEACTVPTYLATQPKQIRGIVQTCSAICNEGQQATPERTCESYIGDTTQFDSAGRLGFDWDYKNVNNELVVDVVFSQANMTYYFYENGKGYQYVTTTTETTQRNDAGQSSVYYDDGNGYIKGYSGAGSTSFQSSVINTKVTQDVNGYMFDNSALEGKYYGLGQAKFFQEQYKALEPQAQYLDQFGIPFGKHQLNSTTISDSATFLDAIKNNMEFVIDGQSMPYTIKALSGNHFQLTVRPEKSYLTSNASLIFKNPALVRSDQTALQTPTVSKQLDRLDYYSQNQLLTATSLRDRTATIVQILWGICKYILFTGFGWAVMPLMLILQFIFGHNYITSQLPLNLKYFLTSFADFRNPSILFNPQRNDFDRQVVNHAEIYKRVGAYQEFDRGIDFMKNSFQFFFVPLLSFGLQFLLIGINFLVQKVCRREIPIISRYLQPRLGHHAAAYTLVQALPISFFFFGQLQDTRYNHVSSPNSVYPSFNTGMSYASFFASAIIPLILLTGIYNYFKNKARSGNFDFEKVKGSTNNVQTANSNDPAMLADPLWGGNPFKTASYGFGSAIFYLPLLAGFVLSFFTKSYPWQLTGLLLGFLGLTSFAAASKHFDNKIPRFFWIAIGVLMIAYLLVHAGIGSNRALGTYDQWNTGYLGIGIIYAMLLAGIIFSGYLIYKLFKNLYDNIIKPFGCLSKLADKAATLKTPDDEQKNLRDNIPGRRERRETTQMRSKINYFPNQYTEDRILNAENKEHILNDMNIADNQLLTQDLVLQSQRPDGSTVFNAVTSGQRMTFPAWSSKIMKENMPLLIDSKNRIFNKRTRGQVGTVDEFKRRNSDDAILQQADRKITRRSIQMAQINGLQNQSSKKLDDALNLVYNNNKEQRSLKTININGRTFQYREEDDGKNFLLMNFNGNSQQRLSNEDFLNLFMQNKNRLRYENEEYLLMKDRRQEDGEQFYYIQSPNQQQKQYTVTKQQIYQMISPIASQAQAQSQSQFQQAQAQAQSLTKNQRIQSTSFLQSGKTLSQKGGYFQFNPTSNRNITYNKQNKEYLIGGQKYEKINQDAENMYFVNIKTGEKMQVKRLQVQIDSGSMLAEARLESLRAINDGKLNSQRGVIVYQGQQYKLASYENSQYQFINMQNSNPLYLTIEQLASLLGQNIQIMPSAQSLSSQNMQYIQSSRQVQNVQYVQNYQLSMPATATKLMLVSIDKERGQYVYENPRDGSRYEMNMEWIDQSQPVYIDGENFWHKGEMLGEEESSRQQSQLDKVIINQYITSNKTISSMQSLTQLITPSQPYNLKFISPDFPLDSNHSLPSQKDILELKENIMGADLQRYIAMVRDVHPRCRVVIQSVRNPSQKFILED